MTLSFTQTSHTDPESIAAYHKVIAASTEHDLPGFPVLTPRMASRMHEHPWVGRRSENYLAWRDGEPVGRLEVEFPTRENLNKVSIRIDVAPAFRRQGIGRALWDKAVELARANDRTKVNANSAWTLPGLQACDGGAGPAYATAMGFQSANLPEVMRRLDLSTLDHDCLDELLEKARAKSGGYRIVQWKDVAPDEYVADVAYLDSRVMQDIPLGDLEWEAEQVDVDLLREGERIVKARGRTSYHTGAVHEATNSLVAWTTLSKMDEQPWHTWQQITIVEPRHRGHRLGALVKVENLLPFLKEEPGVRIIDTFNAAENSYMISINEAMGFRPIYAFQNWHRDL